MNDRNSSNDFQPIIPASQSLPEITVKALILGVLLSVVLAGANAYLGLFAGMTVSASIPAAVISMGVLSLFKKHNILENNIVQTAASSGESLAAGVIFTLPALVLMGYWTTFPWVWVTLIAGLGGLIGVLFTIILRRALIIEGKLLYPEGIATAEVLKSGEEGGSAVWYIAIAGLIGAFFKLCETGFHFWAATLEGARRMFGSIFYFGSNLSPALVSVGYIVGLNISVLVFSGGFLSWVICIPIYYALNGAPPGDFTSATDIAYEIWSEKVRYIGVGCMVVGGLWALVSLKSAITKGIRAGLNAYSGSQDGTAIDRTERDVPTKWVFILLAASMVPLYAYYLIVIKGVAITLFLTIFMLIAAALFSAVAGYMAGLVGSSNNPISGVTIATILSTSLLLLVMMGAGHGEGPAAAILVGAVVCCAAAISGDTLQDLKAGYLLGATPYKQQIMEVVGTLSAALVMAPVLLLLLKAYGFGEPTAAHPNPLTAPQATLMASVAEGVFTGDLPWDMILIGALIGVGIISFDKYLERRGSSFRAPILAVAVGIYLPIELSTPIFIGGLISYFLRRRSRKFTGLPNFSKLKSKSDQAGLLFASGLITGEAIVGILMAIPIVISGNANVLALMDSPLGGWPGLVLLLLVCYILFKAAANHYRKKTSEVT
ncbi:oligopeptide transporter, OPT family [candidate division LCP-89 bacterium B3_LCP]|uniref:Oligopeptide transporter, OPT family n=1 Tax=candidate division LCP-89 bacterium B3_LCP TaxID=2012998 RepID=A0A532V419_UNCL8|nr:MAG: oligopeptide transporter, OPT family [candidate division LCP-89 bacterium B3_LCP]